MVKLRRRNSRTESPSNTTLNKRSIEDEYNSIVEETVRNLWYNRGNFNEETSASSSSNGALSLGSHLDNMNVSPAGMVSVIEKSKSYINTYCNNFNITNDKYDVIVAAIFLSFKCADYIPGIGRIKLSQVSNALLLHAQGATINGDNVCDIEMKMMCLTNFNFD
jgi:hypothetical protein